MDSLVEIGMYTSVKMIFTDVRNKRTLGIVQNGDMLFSENSNLSMGGKNQ